MSARIVVSLAAAVLTGVLGFLSLELFRVYGFSVFVFLPFLSGFTGVTAATAWRRDARGFAGIAMLSGLTPLCCAFSFGVEGLICLAMALPLTVPMSLLGGLVAYRLQDRRGLGAIILPPFLAGGEVLIAPEPSVRPVTTAVVIDAPPSAVWKNVVSFPELSPPDELLFRAGVAYPIRAEIEGSGPGAIRKCVFSTGAFIEPITVWDEPRRLAFGVTSQPPTMRELSPWMVEPPHLEGYFVSRRGEFELQELPGSRTLLKGTTWYSNRMWPEAYWRLWADHILHKIHLRVLHHIRERTINKCDFPDGVC